MKRSLNVPTGEAECDRCGKKEYIEYSSSRLPDGWWHAGFYPSPEAIGKVEKDLCPECSKAVALILNRNLRVEK